MFKKKKKKDVLSNFEASVKRRDEEYGDYSVLKCKLKVLVEKHNTKLYSATIYGNSGCIEFLNPIPDGVHCEIETLGLRITSMKEDENYYCDPAIHYTRFDLKLKVEQVD